MPNDPSQFEPGQLVALQFDPQIRGAVLQVLPGSPETRYTVFHGGATTTYYESQLQAVDSAPGPPADVAVPELRARLTALQLLHPGVSSLYALHAARVNFIPYQFRPVLKFIHADRPRLLVADEVGVGKTIEAGLILREMQARREVRSVLVICPKPLVTERKWQKELRRFDEDFEHLDGERLRFCLKEADLEGDWPERYAKSILPFSLFDEELLHGSGRGRRRVPGLLDLDPAPRFDFVIVDEAHAIRNPDTLLHQGVRLLCDRADAVVFLTATPIQLGASDLFTLLNVLRPDLVIDPPSFEHMTAPNPHINRASSLARAAEPGWEAEARQALEEAGATRWGQELIRPNPEFQRLLEALHTAPIGRAERVEFTQGVERLHTLDRLLNRTRRRDIGAFTTRKPETLLTDFTPEQEALHRLLLDVQARLLEAEHGPQGVAFMLSTLRRQAASSIHGLAPLIRAILERRVDLLEWDEMGGDDGGMGVPGDLPTALAPDVRELLTRAESLGPTDPKFDRLCSVVRDKQGLPNNKLLLFSGFRHTLGYLWDRLAGEDVRIGVVHGGIDDEERRDTRHRFALPREDPEALDLLLSSEVGSEGLDYQFCDALVNYDLPWNPMRVEQRIGRLDRYGQKSPAIVIYNLITGGTVDADVYFRCLMRIGVFQEALGGSEEILGRIGRELRRIGDDLQLSEDERRARLEQLADNEVRAIQEQGRLEAEQSALFGVALPPAQRDQDVHDAASDWLAPEALQNLVRAYTANVGTGEASLLGSGAKQTLRASQADRERLLQDYRRLSSSRSPVYREWERWLKGSDPHLAVTFDSGYATDHRAVTFITPVHPLAQQAAHALAPEQPLAVTLRVRADEIEPGVYPFAIYRWESRGLRTSSVFQPVCTDPGVEARFFELLATAESGPAGDPPRPPGAALEELEARQYALWSQHREEHRAETLRLADFRRSSLRRSHEARLAMLHQQISSATHPNIRRMHLARVDAAQADHARRSAELDAAEGTVDVVTRPVADGYIHIHPLAPTT